MGAMWNIQWFIRYSNFVNSYLIDPTCLFISSMEEELAKGLQTLWENINFYYVS